MHVRLREGDRNKQRDREERRKKKALKNHFAAVRVLAPNLTNSIRMRHALVGCLVRNPSDKVVLFANGLEERLALCPIFLMVLP